MRTTGSDHYITEFGAIGDGMTNDREALREALRMTASAGDTLVIDKPLFVEIPEEKAMPIRLYPNTTVRFEGKGKLIVKHDKLPVFWSLDASELSFTNMVVEYKGIHSPVFDQSFAADLNDHLFKQLNSAIRWTGPAAFMSVFHLRGGSGFTFVSPHFIADTIDPAALFALCFYFGGSDIASPISRIRITSPVFDGYYMGILSQNFDGLYLTDVHSIRYGVLPSGDGTSPGGDGGWFPPPHILYNSAASTNLVLDGVLDEGVFVGGGNWGQTSLKPTRIDQFVIRNVTSHRDHGLIDFNGSNGQLENLSWRGDATKCHDGKNGVFPVRWLNAEGKVQANVHWANIDLYDVSTTYRGPILSITNSMADRLVYCTMRNVNINQETWKDGGLVQDWMEHCEFEVNWTIRNPVGLPPVILLWGAKNSAAPNKFTGRLNGFSGSRFRVIATKGSVAEFSSLTGRVDVEVDD